MEVPETNESKMGCLWSALTLVAALIAAAVAANILID